LLSFLFILETKEAFRFYFSFDWIDYGLGLTYLLINSGLNISGFSISGLSISGLSISGLSYFISGYPNYFYVCFHLLFYFTFYLFFFSFLFHFLV